jgi:MFS family permease
VTRAERTPWWPGLLVFVVALAIRIFFLTLIPRDALQPSTDWELDSIAMSLVTTGEFANPYIVPTGPTAHLPPIPPIILALIYKVFGVTMVAGIAGWLFRMLAQSAIWGLLPWIGVRVGLGWKAGFMGGLAGALFPQWLAHGEALAAVLLGLLVVAVVRRWESVPRPASSLLLGLAFGVSFHVQPVFLPVLLGYLGFELCWRSDDGKWRSAALVAVAALVACIPWGVRNYRALDSVFFVRSNFGLELRMGNHEGAEASIDHPHFRNEPPHPRTHPEDALKVREWGEIAYMRESGAAARTWIVSNPGGFTRLTAKRIGYFWLGPLDQPVIALLFAILSGLALLGAIRAVGTLPPPRSAVLLIPLLTFPLVYYLVPWQHRYRFPIEWILFLLAGAAVWDLVNPAGAPGRTQAPAAPATLLSDPDSDSISRPDQAGR